jgi:hypothetical protein
MREQATALANRVQKQAGQSTDDRVRLAHRLVFGREPSTIELAIAREFLPADSAQSTFTVLLKDDAAVAPTFSGKRVRAELPELGDNYTVEMWIRNTEPVKSRPVTGYFFSRGAELPPNDHGDHFGISGTSGGKPGRLLFYNGLANKTTITGSEILKVNHWYHVAMVRKGESVSLYLNGDSKGGGSGAAKLGYPSGANLVYVGGRRDNFANFRGQLQEAAIFDRALSGEEIARHYTAASLVDAQSPTGKLNSHAKYAEAILASQPMVYWPLRTDPLTVTQATDSSGKSNHGTYEERTAAPAPHTRWSRYIHAMLSSNEFLFID